MRESALFFRDLGVFGHLSAKHSPPRQNFGKMAKNCRLRGKRRELEKRAATDADAQHAVHQTVGQRVEVLQPGDMPQLVLDHR
jgi:hypothetical protein